MKIAFLIPIVLGLINGVIQSPRNRTTLRSRLMLILLASILIALIPGWRLYMREVIDINTFYLLLINAGTSAGVLILLERLLLKHWRWTLVAGAIIGIISVLITHRHTTGSDPTAFLLGMLVGGGYMLGGIFLKTWRKT
ncbi:MAG: hypothetical protein M0R44_03610 [Candidatus Marinimicrobia bacterium]|jgi:hypothetical protein|nr:hypothetical protein [Candidatus Neomarinimicrobiota bacterium]MDD5062374.1 hypothetical protein [Candidatus Neomarinimicrobiota bacterium]